MRGPSPGRNGRRLRPGWHPIRPTHSSNPTYLGRGRIPPDAPGTGSRPVRPGRRHPIGFGDSERVVAWREFPNSSGWLSAPFSLPLVTALADLAGGDRIRRRYRSEASALYKEAMATTKAWRVHYVSTSNISNVPFFESGNAGPASGTQTILIGKGATLEKRVTDRHRRSHLCEGQRARHGRPHRAFADRRGGCHGSLGLVLEQQPEAIPKSSSAFVHRTSHRKSRCRVPSRWARRGSCTGIEVDSLQGIAVISRRQENAGGPLCASLGSTHLSWKRTQSIHRESPMASSTSCSRSGVNPSNRRLRTHPLRSDP